MKLCGKCKSNKPSTEFSKNARRPDGLNTWCKSCHSEYRRSRYLETGVKEREQMAKYSKTAKGRSVIQMSSKAWKRRNLEKYRAHVALNNALKLGRISKEPCEVCGRQSVDAHHDNYERPLDVRWLCRKHHRAAHAA